MFGSILEVVRVLDQEGLRKGRVSRVHGDIKISKECKLECCEGECSPPLSFSVLSLFFSCLPSSWSAWWRAPPRLPAESSAARVKAGQPALAGALADGRSTRGCGQTSLKTGGLTLHAERATLIHSRQMAEPFTKGHRIMFGITRNEALSMPHYIRQYSTESEAEFAGRDTKGAKATQMDFVDSLGDTYTRWVSSVGNRYLRTNGEYEYL